MTQPQKTQLEREFADLADQLRAEQREAIGEQALYWLALLPEWTFELAHSCGFPETGGDLEGLLRRAESVGLCTLRSESPAGPPVRFWMPTPGRQRLFEEWRQQGAAPRLEGEIAGIAARIAATDAEGAWVSPGVRRWAELARRELAIAPVTGEALGLAVRQALSAGDTALAGEWVFAAEELALALGAEMTSAAARQRGQLHLHYRRLQDERYLTEFVEREEQIDEIRELLEPDKHWAVHFFGQGGVGKTMLMRYLTGNLPDADPFTFSARIDFDRIDPRFPLEAPARLLAMLGEGLAAKLENAEQEAKYRSFEEAVTRSEAIELDPHQPEPLETDEFGQVIDSFKAFLETLPSPVVLILDTCEELAKSYPAGADLPNVRAMFEIIERVHAQTPEVRVVLAGRRWLTREAANRVRGMAAPEAVKQMEPRKYMKMHPARGFTRSEVVTYLRAIRRLDVDDAMIEAILEHTEDEGFPASDEESVDPDDTRYSPSDVALFAGWIEREPGLSPIDLAGGNRDPFVEVRIFERIQSPAVLAAIPAAMLLERFDPETIRPALEGGPRVVNRAIEGLIEQEWTHLEDGPGPDGIVISIDAKLLRRLGDYFARDPGRRLELARARERLTPHLRRLLELPTAEVAPDQIDSAVRALPIEESLTLFDELAKRVAGERAWSWAEAVCRFLLSDERKPELPTEMTASVRALYASALTHRQTSEDLGKHWDAVAATAHGHPGESKRKALRARARLGKIVAGARNGGVDSMKVKGVLVESRRLLHQRKLAPEIAPGLLAALEAITDAREERGHPIPAQVSLRCLTALLEHFKEDEAVWSYVLTLEGRVRALTGDWAGAREAFDRFEDTGPPETFEDPRFGDWVPPYSIHHRALLELLRFRLADERETPALLETCERSAIERPGGADGAQLLSLALQARLASGAVERGAVERAAELEASLGRYEASRPAHAVAPPLFVSLADAWLAVGEPARGLELLAEREQAAASGRIDERSEAAAALASIRILRRLRSPGRLGLISGLSAREVEERSEAMAAGALIAGLSPPLGSDSDHYAWRARNLLDPQDEIDALRAMRRVRIPLADGPERLHLALDHLEAEVVERHRSSFRGIWVLRAALNAKRIVDARRDVPSIGDPLGAEALRITLRSRALLGQPDWPINPTRMRQVGWMALEEGELLGLRLPTRARALLDHAGRCLDEAGDAHGAFFAALLSAIADIHAGRIDEARARRADIERRFQQVHTTASGMLASATTHGSAEGVRGGATSDPWLHWNTRLRAYRAWCDDPPADNGVSLTSSPELALVPALGAPGTAVPGRSAPAHQVASAIGFALALLCALVLVRNRIDAGLLVVLVILLVVLVVATVALEKVARSVPRAILPVDVFDISISPAPRWPSRDMVKVLVEPWSRRRFANRYFKVWRRLRPGLRWEALISSRDEIGERRPRGPLALALRPGSGGRLNPIRLSVTSNLAQIGWEWRLAGHLSREPDWTPEQVPPIWRVRARSSLGLEPEFFPRSFAAVCSSQWRPLVQSMSAAEVPWLAGTSESRARAAIALGFPVMTRAGWRLRLDDEPVAGLEEPGRPRAQQLLSADWLAHRAPIAVVVGRPAGRRVSLDRRTAEGLRGFANEVFLAGARAVIVVPPLPARSTAAALELLTETIGAWTELPDTESLLDLTGRLRGAVWNPPEARKRASDLDPERLQRERSGLAELTFDICLFAPR